MKITTIGFDIAKNVFQVHAIDGQENVVLRKRLRRTEVLSFFANTERCLVGMEACGTAHYWAREIQSLGHEVKLLPASYVKPYVKRGKNDAADAEAICEAVTRRTMRFVPVKSVTQQAVLMLHGTRDLLVRQRTMLVNALRGHLAEYGLVTAHGIENLKRVFELIDQADTAVPSLARPALFLLMDQIVELQGRIRKIEREILNWHRKNIASSRLEGVPGIGPLTASAIVASVGDASQFRSGRQLAAWLGLVPRQNSTGGKERLGRISKQGNIYIRRLLVLGATSLIRVSRSRTTPMAMWVNQLLARRPARLVSVALANKIARVAWVVLARGEIYRRVEAAPT
jgi:transposase